MSNPQTTHLRVLVDDVTDDVWPMCKARGVTKQTSSSWMNNVTCAKCREGWHETTGIPKGMQHAED